MEKDYYKSENGVTVYDVLEMSNFHYGFYLGNIVKYVMRADKKDDQKTAFEKAFDYLSRYIRACYGEMSLDNFMKFTKTDEYNRIFTSLQTLCVADKFSQFVDYIVRHYHKKTNGIPESCEISFNLDDIEAFKDMCVKAIIDYVPLIDTIRDILVKCEEGKPFVYNIPQDKYRDTVSWMKIRWIISDKKPEYRSMIEKIMQRRILFE